jgi:opacity protein-like surface antigen
MASEYDILFGLGYGQIKRTYDFENLQLKDENAQNKFQLKLGFKDIDSRSYISLSYLEADKSEKQYGGMFNFEALSDDYLFYDFDFNMFWGFQVGALKVDFEDKNRDKTYSSTNIAYGLQGGVLFDITKSLDLELGYESVWSPLNIKDMNLNGSTYNYSFDYNQNLYIGLNYSF